MDTAQAQTGKGGDAFRGASPSYREYTQSTISPGMMMVAITSELALAAASAAVACERLGEALVRRGEIYAGWQWFDTAAEARALLAIAQADAAWARRAAGLEHALRPSDMIRRRRRQA